MWRSPLALPFPRVGAAVLPLVLLRLPEVDPRDTDDGAALRDSRLDGTAVVGDDRRDDVYPAWATLVPGLRHFSKGLYVLITRRMIFYKSNYCRSFTNDFQTIANRARVFLTMDQKDIPKLRELANEQVREHGWSEAKAKWHFER